MCDGKIKTCHLNGKERKNVSLNLKGLDLFYRYVFIYAIFSQFENSWVFFFKFLISHEICDDLT